MAKGKTVKATHSGRAKPSAEKSPWQKLTLPISKRYDQEFLQQSFDLPEEVESMAIFQDWASGKLQNQIASTFWTLYKPKKNQKWLDIGCGISFLIYPWRDWNALFYGQDVSPVVNDIVKSRGPQLNSKLFKEIQLGGAHALKYEDAYFDGAIATGWTSYYDLDYNEQALQEIKRVLAPKGTLLIDLLNPDSELAEDWAILETYLGAEVMLTDPEDWKALLKKLGGKIIKSQEGCLFHQYLVRFP